MFHTSVREPPLVLAYGIGVDSTAILVHWKRKGIRPDRILFADVGAEKEATYQYKKYISRWLVENGFPAMVTVQYKPKLAPYTTLEGNMCMNCTLPSITFGGHSCSVKFKIGPQDKYCDQDHVCLTAWRNDQKVRKVIGYEFGEEKRRNHAHSLESPKYAYEYPLLEELEWTREQCIAEIKQEGLVVPVKSACYFCISTKPEELHDMTPEDLGKIIRVEVLAEPYNHRVGGLWRKATKKRPGSMTQYILDQGLEVVIPPPDMPINPKCNKAKRGVTFVPPYTKEPSLRDLLKEHGLELPDQGHLALELEHELHLDMINFL